jgi:hypothetical protein
MALPICKILRAPGIEISHIEAYLAVKNDQGKITAQYQAVSNDSGIINIWYPMCTVYWGGRVPVLDPSGLASLAVSMPDRDQPWIAAGSEFRLSECPACLYLMIEPRGDSYNVDVLHSVDIPLSVEDSSPECNMSDASLESLDELTSDLLTPESLRHGQRKRKRELSDDGSKEFIESWLERRRHARGQRIEPWD